MKKVKNNPKKEQNLAQVENNETVATVAATEVTNPTSEKKDKKSKKDKDSSKKDKKSKKAKVIETTEAKKDKVVKEVAKKQKDSVRQEVISEREVKYIYPSDEELLAKYPNRKNCSIKDLKKTWRQECRNEYRKLQRKMMTFVNDQNSKEYKAAKKAFEKYASTILKPGMAL